MNFSLSHIFLESKIREIDPYLLDLGQDVSTLDLEIEIGRYQGRDRENRICKLCSNGLENEVYFLFHCSRLEHIRKQFDSILKFDENIPCDKGRFYVVKRIS